MSTTKMGRPRIEIDWELVEKLAQIMCTQIEICSVIGCSVDTITRACKEKYGSTFAEYIKTHQNTGKASLRRAQFQAALKGNPTMLIWMGKQFLGQADKVENTLVDRRDVSEFSDAELEALADTGREVTH